MNSSDTPRPKPAPPKPKAPTPTPAVENDKPKFVRKPHLTERPFKNHEGLAALHKKMKYVTPSQSRTQKEKK